MCCSIPLLPCFVAEWAEFPVQILFGGPSKDNLSYYPII